MTRDTVSDSAAWTSRRGEPRAHLVNDELVARVHAGRQLGIDQNAVHGHFVAATVGWDQDDLCQRMRLVDGSFECIDQSLHQTGGAWGVVSSYAEFNRDTHLTLLLVDRHRRGHVPAQPRIALLRRNDHLVGDVALFADAHCADAQHFAGHFQVRTAIECQLDSIAYRYTNHGQLSH